MKNLLLFIIIVSLISSCSDSKTQGCTDLYAINYNPSVDYDNGSCIYEVDIVFALDGNSAAYLNADEYATEVAYYIDNDGIPVGIDYWDPIIGFPFAIPTINPPLCYQSGYTSFTYQWSGAISTSFSYEAIPNGGIFDWIGTELVYNSDQCIYIPLTLAKQSRKFRSPSLEEASKEIKNRKQQTK
ncbi:MAG: hypothetical protein CMD19_06170 [Flavobacteriales bacterium]|jgi:hypothetical protein|nr:hypothetical protein [Flavobacteriales bacterium]|tara:strand:- start:20094 stop:20648 length:555 start_codon:yes stop_codon:yes gene_type:complete